MLRYLQLAWRWLTSMRTALVLLFLLAVGAIPGALLPQRNVSKTQVAEYLEAHGTTAKVYDKLQFFDVFSSTWFSAIYVLLFVSLIGCIVPRSWEHFKAMRAQPVRAPRNLSRLPKHATGELDMDCDAAVDLARSHLKGWRLAEYSAEQDRAGARSVAAERGYAREVFNLMFHLGLVGILLTVGLGRLTYYEGNVIVVTGAENTQFCNTAVANYDNVNAGALFNGTQLKPFCVDVKNFSATYLPNGQADMFSSDISYARGDKAFQAEEQWDTYQLKVNHPLRLPEANVYLQGHGFAPRFTVTWPNGETRTQMVQFAPDDPQNLLSSGVMRFDPPAGMYPDSFERRQNQLAIQGLFAPTASFGGEKGTLLTSSYPQQRNPAVAVDIYRGDVGLDSGKGQNIFTLDSAQVHSGALQKIDRVNLMMGESATLDDGTVVTFEGANDFVNLEIHHDGTQLWVLAAAIITLIGMVGSVSVKRRRVWVRFTPAAAGTTHVELGGLARTDRAGWGREFDQFHRRLCGLPDPDLEPDVDPDYDLDEE